jgi:hypothetical protein
MNAAVLCALLGICAAGLGLVAASVTRRHGPTLAGGGISIAVVYLLYVLAIGEGAPFARHVVVAGAVGSAVLLGGFTLGVGLWRALERRSRVP